VGHALDLGPIPINEPPSVIKQPPQLLTCFLYVGPKVLGFADRLNPIRFRRSIRNARKSAVFGGSTPQHVSGKKKPARSGLSISRPCDFSWLWAQSPANPSLPCSEGNLQGNSRRERGVS